MKLIKIFLIICLASTQLQAQETGLRIGDKAPNLVMTSPDGEQLSLYDLKGQIVLIDFWASWCRPCRAENPKVVKAYQKYKDKSFKNGEGFTVFGVSLDKNKNSWKTAIKSDGLTWPYHVSDLKHWHSEAAKTFQIRGIPNNYLINGDGIIIGKSLRGPHLESALEAIVEKKKSRVELEKDVKLSLEKLKKHLSEELSKEKDKGEIKHIKKQLKKVKKAMASFS